MTGLGPYQAVTRSIIIMINKQLTIVQEGDANCTLETICYAIKLSIIPADKKITELIYLYFPRSFHLTVVVSVCRASVVITAFSTGLVGVEVTSVSCLGQLTVGV